MEAALWGLLPSVLVGVAAPVAAQLVQRGVNRAYVVSGRLRPRAPAVTGC